MRRAMDRAMETYKASEGNTRLDSRWRRKQERAMTSDLSWNVAAEKYEKLMGKIALDPPPALRRPAPELLEAAARRRRRKGSGVNPKNERSGCDGEPPRLRATTPGVWTTSCRRGCRCSPSFCSTR